MRLLGLNISDTVQKLAAEREQAAYDLSFLADPRFGGWRLEEDACRFLGRVCETLRPQRVVEFGSGLSTLVLAHEIKRGNVEEVWSIDHLNDFSGHPRGEILAAGLNEYVHFLHCPIRPGFFGGKLFHFYKLPEGMFNSIKSVDLIIIDGPPYFFESREAVLYLAFPALSENSLILLDDAGRKNREQVYLGNWQRYFGANIESVIYENEFKKGLACIWLTGKGAPVTPFPLFERIIASIRATWIAVLDLRRRLVVSLRLNRNRK